MSTKNIKLHRLGRNGPHVPALGFGVMSMEGAYGASPDDEERFKLLDRAADIGNTFWDTADHYGENEAFLGKWFQRTGRRPEIFLATKGSLVKKDGRQTGRVDSSGEYITQACLNSLQRLGIDHIDLYYVGRVNPEIPIEETMHALVQLQRQGRIHHIGLSEVSSNTLIRACKIAPVAAVQMEYSPFELSVEREAGTNLLDTCRDLGVSVVCYSPLGRGMLTSTLLADNGATAAIQGQRYPRFSKENLPSNLAALQKFHDFATRKNCTVSQLALAWLMKQGKDIIPIPSTKRVQYMEENWRSMQIDLTDSDESEIRQFLESTTISGSRGMPSQEAMFFLDTRSPDP